MPDQDKIACPVCGAMDSEPLQTVEKAPVACGSLFPSSESAGLAEMCRLEFVLCLKCSHIWNSAHQDRQTTQYNEDYYSSKAVSQQAQGYQQSLAEDLDRMIGLSGKTVVEIGCGEGLFLENLVHIQAQKSDKDIYRKYILYLEILVVSLLHLLFLHF